MRNKKDFSEVIKEYGLDELTTQQLQEEVVCWSQAAQFEAEMGIEMQKELDQRYREITKLERKYYRLMGLACTVIGIALVSIVALVSYICS